MRLDGKVAIVTGGAGGNGRGIAEGFAREGARLALADVNGKGAEQVAREIAERHDAEALGLQCDVAQAESVERMVAAVLERFGRIDVLVNNAGILAHAPFLEMTPGFWTTVMRVNLDGAFFCSLAAAQEMVKTGGGSIVNVESMAATHAPPNSVAYCASKGGLHMLTRSMAVDLAPHGIRVNGIAPAIILTDPNRRGFEDDPIAPGQALARVPMGRAGHPDDLAGAAVFLASDEAAYVTGVSLPVDGGYLAR
jgi:NAD(P)-dependent dehydrogenase (short-subunit alcohol dehydrogenase family)